MSQRAWITHVPEKSIIEVSNVDRLWKMLLRDLSPWHKLIADEPDDHGLN